MTTDRPLKVIQWTTGNIGRRSLHAIIGRSDMELVGVYANGEVPEWHEILLAIEELRQRGVRT